MNDWQDYNLAKHGNRSAWNRVVDLHASHLTRLAVMLTGSPDLAQDVVQEVMVELFRNPPKHQDGSLKGWLTTVTYHTALKMKKRLQRWSTIGEIDPPDTNPQPLDSLIRGERDRAMFNIIQALDEVYREVFVLRFYGEKSLQDISAVLAIPLGTVKSRLFNGAKQIRKQMKDRGLT